MRYFIDTEFFEQPGVLELISIALVAEDGRELYLGNRNANVEYYAHQNPWLAENVIPHLPPFQENGSDPFWRPPHEITEKILDLTTEKKDGSATELIEPEFWGYFADYDWVLFCWLFGRMVDLPSHFPKFCRDLKQLAWHLNIPRRHFPPQDGAEHNALEDARWNKKLYESLAVNMPGRLTQMSTQSSTR